MHEPRPAPRGLSLAFAAALLITSADALWVLSLPCFPSADGPIHLYYVHVLGTLLAHSNAAYAHFFTLRHLLQPYSLYYYALLGLSKTMSLPRADQVLVCVYLFSFLFGFRYLARAIGPAADLATLAATLLLLNWPLGMGFVNYCLALALSLWAAGLWVRLEGKPAPLRRVGFVLLATAVLFAHPVPLLLLLAVTGALLLGRMAGTLSRDRSLPIGFGLDAGTWIAASLNLGYLKLFVVAHPLKQVQEPQAPVLFASWHRFLLYAGQHGLAFVLGHSPEIVIYRSALLLMLAAAVGFGIQQRGRNAAAGVWTSGDTFSALGLLLLVGLPWVPSKLNGSFYFADRLVLCVWLAALVGAAGWTGRRRTAHSGHEALGARGTALASKPWFRGVFPVAVACALAAETALLLASDRLLRPAAASVAALEDSKELPPGSVGFLLEDPRPATGSPVEGPAWNPYYWALAHLLRADDAVLANPPWADVTILPVGPSPALPESKIAALEEPQPTRIEGDLLAAPADLQATLAGTSFFAVNSAGRPRLQKAEPLLDAAGAAAKAWSCSQEAWYRLCTKSAATLLTGTKR